MASMCSICKNEGTITCSVCANYMGWPDKFEPKPMLRGDRIRSMTDEELAAWLGDLLYPECPCCPVDCDGWCDDCHGTMLSWLKMAGGLSKRPEENA